MTDNKSELPLWATELLESIDAAVFSADTFHSEETLAGFEFYFTRWIREVTDIKKGSIDARIAEEFKQELKTLLKKYSFGLSVEPFDDEDTFVAYGISTGKILPLRKGYTCIDEDDL